jgi:hypothetical protein
MYWISGVELDSEDEPFSDEEDEESFSIFVAALSGASVDVSVSGDELAWGR